MEKINLGTTHLQASRICLGTWAIGGWLWGSTDDKNSIHTIHEALDQGNTIALWGARKPGQVYGVNDAMGWSLDVAALKEIDAIIKQQVIDPVGPEFMTPPNRDQNY